MRDERSKWLWTGSVSCVLAVLAGAAFGQGLGWPDKSALPSPLNEIAISHPIDQTCGVSGVATKSPAQAQNLAKNNFAVRGTPVTVTYDVLVALEQQAEQRGIPHGGEASLPKDRSILQNFYNDRGIWLGEGTLVQYVATIIKAEHSNVSKGEGVNCNLPGDETNDIHIELGQHHTDDACLSTTAEMSPHFRPDEWSSLPDEDFGERPVRVTGPLMFDASHVPCHDGKKINPARVSLWEIHPVYSLDVCRNIAIARCKASDESAWVPLHEWTGRHAHTQPLGR